LHPFCYRWSCPCFLLVAAPFWTSLACLLCSGGAKLGWVPRGTTLHMGADSAIWRCAMVQCDLVGATKPHEAVVVWVENRVWWAKPMGSHSSCYSWFAYGHSIEFWRWVGGWTSCIHSSSAPIDADWTQEASRALVWGCGEHVQSDNVEMSAMMAVLKLCQVRQDTLSSVLEECWWWLSTIIKV
jgi:hypothetical protein